MAISIVKNMDCVEGMKEYPDNYFQLAITDPPYGIGENGQRNITGDRPTNKWRKPTSQKYKPFDDSQTPKGGYFKELFRVSVNQIIWGGNYFTEYLPPSKGWIVWDKKADIKEHLSMCELAWSSFDRKCNKFEFLWAGFKKQVQEQRISVTQKPVALYKWLLTNYAKPGESILDTHLGSGSSRIAAYDLGFDFTGFELDKDYFDAQERRFAEHVAQPKLFEPVPEKVEQVNLF